MECSNCNSSWNDKTGVKLSNCPLCQYDITKTSDEINTGTPVNILKSIVNEFTADIYNDSRKFKSILSDCITDNKKLIRLLHIIIDHNAASDIYKNSNLDNNQFNLKIRTMLFRISEDSFIAQDILSDGVVLLCQGLGKDFIYNTEENTEENIEENDTWTDNISDVQPIDISDFNIENGVLIKYIGINSNIIIPNSVISIGDSAFRRCSSLESINIPNSVISIDDFAFSECDSLKSINIPNSVISISKGAFYGCSSLESINIPNSVTSIGDYAFYECSSLESINIPNTVTYIGEGTFSECSWLESINIPNTVTSIGEEAFGGCSSLESVNIPRHLKIDDSVFDNCHPNLKIKQY